MAFGKWSPATISTLSIVLAALAIVSCLFYNPPGDINKQEILNSTLPVATTTAVAKQRTKPLLNPMFPRCYTHHIYTVLAGILNDLHFKNGRCVGPKCRAKPDPDPSTKQTTGLIVAYAAVALLLVSLLAAFVELLRAKRDPVLNKTKPELSRRCSLADLTVLRHSRRESLMRRDSSLSIGEPSGRVSLKTIGRSSSLRRSSISINPSENMKCRGMLTDEGCTCISETHHRIRILRHH